MFICFYSHTPKAKATIVADTPEMKRLADNTKIQSNVQYHAEFEATKSNFTAVVDDPGKFPKKFDIQWSITYSRLLEFQIKHFFHLTNKKKSYISMIESGRIIGSLLSYSYTEGGEGEFQSILTASSQTCLPQLN